MTIYLSGDVAVKSGDQVSMSFREKEFSWVVGTVISKGCAAYVLRRDDLGVISFDGCVEFGNYDYVEDLVNALAKARFIVNGTIDFTGDYEGRYHVKENEIRLLSESEMHVEDADTKTLINEIVKRGFVVLKEGKNVEA